MISKTNRFHGHRSLNAVYRYGQTVNLPQMSLKYLATKPGKKYRVAVVVSRKVNKSAVVRNRIRRRIYEMLRQKMPPQNNTDIVITVFDDQIATLKGDTLNDTLDQLLLKAKLTEQPSRASGRDIVDDKEEE